jgi:hypothetical protein
MNEVELNINVNEEDCKFIISCESFNTEIDYLEDIDFTSLVSFMTEYLNENKKISLNFTNTVEDKKVALINTVLQQIVKEFNTCIEIEEDDEL